MSDEKTEKPNPTVEDLSQAAANEQQSDLYLYNGPVNDNGYAQIIGAISAPKQAKKAILLITTFGGSAESAYKIARWFQRFYPEFWLYPTSVCASAGTLVAMGAFGLFMSPFSELGPLDVQLTKKNELDETKSGLVTKAALQKLQESALSFWEYFMLEIKRKGGPNLSFDTCSNIASSVCSAVFGELYKKIEPEILGQDDRDLKVAQEYGMRLANWGKNIVEESIKTLVEGYPSHNFVIDKEESATLFEKVFFPPQSVMQVALSLGPRGFVTNTSEVEARRLVSAVVVAVEITPEEKSNEQDSSPKANAS
jgi:hypothetical protein